jgi:DNA polymerase-4
MVMLSDAKGAHRDATILHADLDAYYASVEQLLRPELRGRPIAVGGGVVLACSYEAKAYGVRSGMAGSQARKLCPDLVVVDGHFGPYLDLSEQVFAICRDFTPLVEQISIDEAFLDVTGSTHLFGDGGTIGTRVRGRVQGEIGLAISVGAATTKFLAKVASQVAKPDGLVVVPPGRELDFLHPLPVSLMWGVGPVTQGKLAEFGVRTIGDLADVPREALSGLLGGGAGRHLHALAWNRDPRGVVTRRRAGSVSAQSAFGRAGQTSDVFRRVLLNLADRVGSRLRKKERAGRTITVRVRFRDMQSITRASTLPSPVSTTEAIFRTAWALATTAVAEEAQDREVSLFGISVSQLTFETALQLELPLDDGAIVRPGSVAGRRYWELDRSVDAVRTKFGKGSVGAASLLLGDRTGAVPDEFRELAEAREE